MTVRVWCYLDRTMVSRNLVLEASQKTIDESAGLLILFRDAAECHEHKLRSEYGEDIKVTHSFQKEYPFDLILVSSVEVTNPPKENK